MERHKMRIDIYLPPQKRFLRTAVTLVATAALATAAGALGQTALRLIVAGKTVSTDIRIIDGRPYVPLSDMAKAMNGALVKHKGGYEITLGSVDTTTPEAGAVAGGANEVRGTRGKIGQVLFNGKWRFSVLSVDHAASYDSQFLPEKRTFTPSGDTDELVLVRCRMKNGQNETKVAMLSPIHPHHTALTDNQGQSYAPVDYDKRGGHTDEGPTMLPGSQTEFAIVFSVPKGTVLKDLVFSVQNFEETPDGGTDVRITLAQ
jgi:hypothetical protein